MVVSLASAEFTLLRFLCETHRHAWKRQEERPSVGWDHFWALAPQTPRPRTETPGDGELVKEDAKHPRAALRGEGSSLPWEFMREEAEEAGRAQTF